jgi:hypothetical protein
MEEKFEKEEEVVLEKIKLQSQQVPGTRVGIKY